MRKLFLVVALGLVSCKGPSGEKGAKGDAGPGTTTQYTGFITSDDFTVNVSNLNGTGSVSVYLGDFSGSFVESPYFLPGDGVNTYYIANVGIVEIINAKKANATQYRIVVTANSSASSLLKG